MRCSKSFSVIRTRVAELLPTSILPLLYVRAKDEGHSLIHPLCSRYMQYQAHSRKSNVQTVARILIADDQPFVRRAVRELLETQEGWRVCGSVERMRSDQAELRTPPDVIVMDRVVPQMNGLEATRRIRKSPPHLGS